VIPNPIALEAFGKPSSFDDEKIRSELSLPQKNIVMVLMALGHFERKGLPVLLEAMSIASESELSLVVVGGREDSLKVYERVLRRYGLENYVHFVGFQKDPRPFLWAADVLAMPSAYETFGLAAYEGAAAGLPVLGTNVHGLEDLIVDGETGWIVGKSPVEVAAGIKRVVANRARLSSMGNRALQRVRTYSISRFVEYWDTLYQELLG
jgi:glycosyltransferase involved in cell wall biosynthesis